jgi:hypothetical protein
MSKRAKVLRRRLKKNPKLQSRTPVVPQFPSLTELESKQLARVGPGHLQSGGSKSADQVTAREAIAKCHPEVLGDVAYSRLADLIVDTGQFNDASLFAHLEFHKQMRPKDALERLALTQALLAHARTTWLTVFATRQKDASAIRIACEAADRSAGTLARLMRAFAEYRHPKTANPTVSIGQASLAHNQVVQNVQRQESPHEKDDEQTRISQSLTAKVLLPLGEGTEVTESCNPTNAALERQHGTKKSRGKSSGVHERAQTRRAVVGGRRPAKTDKKDD